MMWDDITHRLVLLELVLTARTQQRRAQAEVWDWLVDLPWTVATNRRGERALVETSRPSIIELMQRVWPTWQVDAQRLGARGLPPTPDGWRDLRDAERAESLPAIPGRVNRRTAAAVVGPHSKAELTEQRVAALGSTELTHDGVLRLRTPFGSMIRRGTATLSTDLVVSVLGEVALPERALIDGTTIEGPIRAVILVENLGPFQDMEAVRGAVIAHVPGWETHTVRRFLAVLPAAIQVFHFGDLDPNGVRIAAHLSTARPGLRWAVPAFWTEYVDERGQPGVWPDDLDVSAAPNLVRDLAKRDLWLEQETLVLDPRLAAFFEDQLSDVVEVEMK